MFNSNEIYPEKKKVGKRVQRMGGEVHRFKRSQEQLVSDSRKGEKGAFAVFPCVPEFK
jgi:hypothetical protein